MWGGKTSVRVELFALEQGTFFARLVVDQAGHQLAIDSRPSDAVALVVRVAVPIYLAETVLDQAGVVPEQPQKPEEPTAAVDVSQLSVVKEFIDTLEEKDHDADGNESSS